MPGSNNGTGQPLNFQCSVCRARRRRGISRGISEWWAGSTGHVRLTGRKRYVGRGGVRSDVYAREYVCASCGHTGWSKHRDLVRVERRQLYFPDDVPPGEITAGGARYDSHND